MCTSVQKPHWDFLEVTAEIIAPSQGTAASGARGHKPSGIERSEAQQLFSRAREFGTGSMRRRGRKKLSALSRGRSGWFLSALVSRA